MKIFGLVLFIWYVFWGLAIKPKSIPGLLQGQLTIWLLYAVLILVFIGSLSNSPRAEAAPVGPFKGPPFAFSWRGFILACAVATSVTTVCRLLLFPFAGLQVAALFTFYVLAGLLLFAGSIRYSLRPALKAMRKSVSLLLVLVSALGSLRASAAAANDAGEEHAKAKASDVHVPRQDDAPDFQSFGRTEIDRADDHGSRSTSPGFQGAEWLAAPASRLNQACV
jgi:hypothetical protein